MSQSLSSRSSRELTVKCWANIDQFQGQVHCTNKRTEVACVVSPAEKKVQYPSDRGRTRTCNLRIRNPTPYPLGHTTRRFGFRPTPILQTSIQLHTAPRANRSNHCSFPFRGNVIYNKNKLVIFAEAKNSSPGREN